ncbi:MAG TPA: hypothetical protein VFL42_14975 [Terriglobales bacterium]|nr:hypothetical protein [Terriglobales bacterium]
MTVDTAATREPVQHRRNTLLWTGALLLVVAIVSNALFFVQVPGQRLLPWLNLLLFILPVILVVVGLRRAITQPETYKGKTAGWILSALSVFLLAFAGFALYASRNIPDPSKAPKIGAKAPDFVLPDTAGKPVWLHDLLSMGTENGAPQKAVLLIFYRGYW